MSASEIIMEGSAKYYRYMKPLGTMDVCLACHGDDQAVSTPVQARLTEAYPHDKARGYSKGDLRGAISIKKPIE